MRILIIRHGEPDYEHDCLTEKGIREAKLLADKLEKEKIDYFYVSPLGRARETAAPTLKRFGVKEDIRDWLKEFTVPVVRDDGTPYGLPWDIMPREWMSHPENFSIDRWQQTALSKSGDVEKEYNYVAESFDNLLKEHGYERDGMYYKAVKANHDTIAFFCHFGLESVLLSHILNMPVFALWHATCALPTSVTTLYTEERQEQVASFRMTSFGDVSHLYNFGEEPSFHARFCECFEDDTRH
ncbi:MAG: histidine phosphatase family protein [Butyrivibrio sp.]|uniref:histidine phosphatase family protein n=1 Tax=Butyrivibrio sp. TaxID=28121 RepID=UPI0025E65133|nr:histidine phosphatase family protein [Butyrivibrio sp.]MCR5769966.1 histidine phosphatase family protein [Butyrivibrio sp.]